MSRQYIYPLGKTIKLRNNSNRNNFLGCPPISNSNSKSNYFPSLEMKFSKLSTKTLKLKNQDKPDSIHKTSNTKLKHYQQSNTKQQDKGKHENKTTNL